MNTQNTTIPTATSEEAVLAAIEAGTLDVPQACKDDFPLIASGLSKMGIAPEKLAAICRDAEKASQQG